MILIAILAAGGWYFSKNPEKFKEFIATISQKQNGAQNAPVGYPPNPQNP
jgi:hypothetical protein